MSRETVVTWAVVDAEGELVDAKPTRLAAYKRVEFLDGWAIYNAKEGRGPTAQAHARTVLAPFQVVRCVGEFEVGAGKLVPPRPSAGEGERK